MGRLEADRRGEDALQQDRFVGELEDAAFDPRHHEEVLHEAEQPLRLGADVGRQLLPRRAVERLLAGEHLAAGVDRRDGRSQLVRQDPEEGLALRPRAP